jgi:hypothetical protein
MALLKRLGELNLAPLEQCQQAALAYGFFRRTHHRDQLAGQGTPQKIAADDSGQFPADPALKTHALAVNNLWQTVFATTGP